MESTKLLSSKPSHKLPILLGILGTSATGFAPIFVRISEVGPISTAFWRMCLSIPFVCIWAWYFFSYQGIRWKEVIKGILQKKYWIFFAGFCFASDLAIWHTSITMTSVVNASLFNNLSAMFVPILAWYLGIEKVRWPFFLALAGAFIGIFILIGQSFTLEIAHIWGDLLAISSAVFYSFYILTIKKMRSSLPSPYIMVGVGASASMVLFVYALLMGEDLQPHTLSGTAIVIGAALIPQICGQGLLTASLGQLSPSFAAMIMLLQPLVAALLAWGIFNETMTLVQLIGGLVLLMSILLAQLIEHKESSAEAH